MSAETKTRERWYVTTAYFKDGGKYITGLGPWDTREQALACRTGYEIGTGQVGHFWVDQAKP